MYQEDKCFAENQKMIRGNSIQNDISSVERAINCLAEVITTVQSQADELHARLSPVSAPVPTETRKSGGVSVGTSCPIQERIDALSERAAQVGTQLRDMRDALCI